MQYAESAMLWIQFQFKIFLNDDHRLTVFPLIHSVARELDAMADPHPKVLNFASMIFPFSSTLILNINFSI